MASFKAGLFAGGGRGDWPRDNLETMMLALDAHRHHPQPFTEEELRPYRDAEVPDSQKEVIRRRKVMRAARSKKKRAGLLRELEKRYAA